MIKRDGGERIVHQVAGQKIRRRDVVRAGLAGCCMGALLAGDASRGDRPRT